MISTWQNYVTWWAGGVCSHYSRHIEGFWEKYNSLGSDHVNRCRWPEFEVEGVLWGKVCFVLFRNNLQTPLFTVEMDVYNYACYFSVYLNGLKCFCIFSFLYYLSLESESKSIVFDLSWGCRFGLPWLLFCGWRSLCRLFKLKGNAWTNKWPKRGYASHGWGLRFRCILVHYLENVFMSLHTCQVLDQVHTFSPYSISIKLSLFACLIFF